MLWNIQESFAQVTVWCIGEFGEMLINHVHELEVEEPITVSQLHSCYVFSNCNITVHIAPLH